jgi:phenylacetate-CoA ligase
VPVGVRQSQRLLELAPYLKPTGMFAITSYPFHLAEVAQRVGTDPKGVGFRRLVVGGEPGGSLPETQHQLREIWGAEVSDTYGLSEMVATMGGQCEVHDGIHFVAEDVVYPELIDPASEEPIPIENGAEGELVFTHLIKEATPLVRYRSGDMAHIVATQCACGRVGFKFRVVGRADDMFIVRGVNVFPSSVEAIVREHSSSVTGEYAILLDSPSPKPPVPIMVEGRKGLSPDDQQNLASSLEETIVRRLQFTARMVVVPAGALQVSEQKTRRIFRLYAGQEPPVDPNVAKN